jgi:hypothetical protein
MQEAPKRVTPTEARQASPRKTNFRVLTMSLVLAVIAGGILYAAFYSGQM